MIDQFKDVTEQIHQVGEFIYKKRKRMLKEDFMKFTGSSGKLSYNQFKELLKFWGFIDFTEDQYLQLAKFVDKNQSGHINR